MSHEDFFSHKGIACPDFSGTIWRVLPKVREQMKIKLLTDENNWSKDDFYVLRC
jgi:hypothetical protein